MKTIASLSVLAIVLGLSGTALAEPSNPVPGVLCVVKNRLQGTAYGCIVDYPTVDAIDTVRCVGDALNGQSCHGAFAPEVVVLDGVVDCVVGGSRELVKAVLGQPAMPYACRL